MFYCEACRVKNDWPDALSRSTGNCECCGARANCWDRLSSSLPPAKQDDAPMVQVATFANVPHMESDDGWPFEAAELKIDVYRAPDQGGFGSSPDRHVRVTHRPSGLVADHYEDRSVHRNKVEAMRKLAKLVRDWKAAGAPAPRPKAEDVAAALGVITHALAPTPRTGLCVLPEDAVATLAEVRAAIIEYYDAMVARKHGGVAMDQAMKKIETIFGLHYDTYRDSKGK